MDATSPLTLPPWSIQKRDCSYIKIYLEYEKNFRVTGVWSYSEAVVIFELQVSTLFSPLDVVFSLADDYLFI